jgi:hypothetical protein
MFSDLGFVDSEEARHWCQRSSNVGPWDGEMCDSMHESMTNLLTDLVESDHEAVPR